MRWKLLVALHVVALILILPVALSLWSAPGVFGHTVWRLPTEDRVLALSFDDGPREPDTTALLEVLARHEAHATFFMTGEAASAHPELVAAVAAGGHAIGNHSWSHPRFVLQGPGTAESEITRTDAAIRGAGYGGDLPFRSPFGKKGLGLQWALASLDRPNVLFDVMPTDYLQPGVELIVDQVMAAIQPGSIVVLHDGGGDRSQTVEAVDRLIPRLRAEGWRLVTVHEALGLRVD